tara:strand:- start:2702 stop:3514 length:813 start_codon:yes stop_codon:yes gene_type:complete
MSGCSCSSNIVEDTNPAMDDYKSALTHLGNAIKKAHKTEEGKKLSTEYWTDIVKMLKKAKLGVSMMELGIDDEDEIKNSHDATIDKVKPKPADEKEDGEEKDSDDDAENKQNEQIAEKSVSKAQQRLFGMVHAYNNGDLKSGDVDEDLMAQIKKISKGMTKKDAKKMAKTKHDDLPEKVPSNELYDVLNHLSILLTEKNFDNVESDGVVFNIENKGRKFTIEFDDKFFMVSEGYNFELGGVNDLNEVVETFYKLTTHTDSKLKTEYESLV